MGQLKISDDLLDLNLLELKDSSCHTKIKDSYRLEKIKKELPNCIEEINDELPDGSSLVLAGGAIRSLFSNSPINDYDLYLVTDNLDDEKYGELIFTIVDELSSCGSFVSCTDKSLMVNHSGNMINFVFFKKFTSVQEIFDSFDFSCVMGGYHIKEERFYLSNNFLLDNISKIIKFNTNTSYPIMSLLRVKKYVDRGFYISRNEMLKICLKISQLEITSFDILKKHMGGMYGIKIEKLFDTTKPFNMDEVLEVLSNLSVDYDSDDYLDFECDYTDLHILKLNLLKSKSLTYYESKKGVLLIKNGILEGIFSKKILDDSNLVIKPHSGKFKVYKYVGFDGEKYYSQRDKSFTYELGKVIKPTNISTGLFCGSLNKKKSFTYCGDKNSVLIELLVEGKDIMNISSYDSHSTRVGISNMEVKEFIFTKVIGGNK